MFGSRHARAQTSDTQTDATKSWTVNSESQNQNLNSTRTLNSPRRAVIARWTTDRSSAARPGEISNLTQDIEKTTVQVNATTVRTTTRTFGRNTDGAKTLVQVTEEEARTMPDGGSNAVRTTSNPDANGNLQLVQREIEETKKISKNVEETKTTVMLPGITVILLRDEDARTPRAKLG